MSDLLEVVVAFACFSGIDELPMSEEHELVDQGHNVAAGLVDGKDHRAIIVPSERHERVDDAEGIVRIETCRARPSERKYLY